MSKHLGAFLFLLLLGGSLTAQIPSQGQTTCSESPRSTVIEENVGASAFFIDADVQSPQLIKEALRTQQSPKKAFHLFSHARPGELYIDGAWLHDEELMRWFESIQVLHEVDELYIYGCEFAAGIKGKETVQQIEERLGLSIAASDDITGASGDWVLEVGHTEHALLIPQYPHALQLDTVHYFPPMFCGQYDAANWRNEELHLSTPSLITIVVTVTDGAGNPIGPGNGSPAVAGQYEISNGSPYVYSFAGNPPSGYASLAGAALGIVQDGTGEGMIMSSSAEFYANFKVNGSAQAASMTGKGRFALGTQFKWAGPPNRTTWEEGYSIMSIMAVEDGTIVDITGYDPAVTFRQGNVNQGITADALQINLDAGESYVLASRANSGTVNRSGFLGADVHATAPIAVTTGGSLYAIQTTGSRDLGIDQLVPVDRIGTEYVILRGNGGNAERVIVTATIDATEVYVNGTYFDIMDDGEFLEIPGSLFGPDQNMLVETTGSVYLHHSLRGLNAENADGLNFIPPLSCFNSNELNELSSPRVINGTVYGNSEIHITTIAGSTVTVNGAAPGVTADAVPGTGLWETYRVPIANNGNYTVVSTGPIGVSIFGGSGLAGYGGYFSGFGTAPEITFRTTEDCFGELICLTENPLADFQWELDGVAIPGAVNDTLVPAIGGNYTCTVSSGATCVSTSSSYILTYGTEDTDADGIPDCADLDQDNDGILNDTECGDVATWDVTSTTTANSLDNIAQFSTLSKTSLATMTTSSGTTSMTATAGTELITLEEGVSETYTISLEHPLTDIVLFFDNIENQGGAITRIGNFSFELNDGTVLSNEAFNIVSGSAGFSLHPQTDPAEVVTIETILGIDYISDPDNNGGTSQAYGAVDFEQFKNQKFLSQGARSISFDILAGPAFQCWFGMRGTVMIDSDGDDIRDCYDFDSDQDGCFDVTEAGYADPDGDGQLGMSPSSIDANGQVVGSGGYAGTDPLVIDDTLMPPSCDPDGDGFPATYDIDDDNDGLSDLEECPLSVSNLALSATATQSTEFSTSYPASNAIDGDLTNFQHTAGNTPQAWLDIDLGTAQNIDEIVIYNRNDCCQSRASYSYLMVSNTPFPASTDYTDALPNSELTYGLGDMNGVAIKSFDIGLVARYVRIQLPNIATSANLNLAEVQILDFSACDADADLIPNHLDLDSDNDGIYDVIEGGDSASDTNGDGSIDASDSGFADADMNGMDDTAEGTSPADTDTDTIVDAYELDADGDGCNDVIEAGFTDADDNGLLGSGTFGSGLTVDANGLVTSGTDGYTGTSAIVTNVNFVAVSCDTDGDGINPTVDIDDDNDGIEDIHEACPVYRFNAGGPAYTDAQGRLWTAETGVTGGVTGGDTGTHTNLNSGNTIGSTTDATIYESIRNAGNSGSFSYNLPVSSGSYLVVFHWADCFSNGNARSINISLEATTVISNYTPQNEFGSCVAGSRVFQTTVTDGALDITYGGSGFPILYGLEVFSLDSDGDGVLNQFDLDSDNDGIYDVVEGGDSASDTNGDGVINASDTGFDDADNNGMDDTAEGTSLTDSDADADFDVCELDSDGDGCNDVIEAGFTDADDNGLLGSGTFGSGLTVDANGLVTSGTDGYTSPADANTNSTADYQEAGSAPSINTQPTPIEACVNGTANFMVTATGTALQYQWQVSTDGGTTFVDISAAGSSPVYAGFTSANLGLSNIPQSADGYLYQVLIHSANYRCDTLTSSTAQLSIDTVDPSITCPANITQNVDAGNCSAVVTFTTPVGTDNCPGAITTQTDASGLSSGSAFPVGTTTLEYLVTDATGRTDQCSFTVTVIDDESPTITCPAALTVSADAGICSATGVTLGTPSTADNCPGETVSNDAPAFFAIGTTTVTWTVTDAAGNTATCTQLVTVTDDEVPTITCSAAVTVSADAGQCSATGVTLALPTVIENCPAWGIGNDAPTSFPVGTTTVTWTVTDVAGNAATCTQSVTVTDDESPTITCPADLTVASNSACVATGVTLGTASTTDNCPGETVSNDAPATFPLGTTTVTWTVTDASGNTATCTQEVTVTDDVDPTITCPAAVTVSADAGQCSATGVTLGTPSTTDNCPGETVSNDAPTSFPVGTTTVTWTVSDAAGNTATCTQSVTVTDDENPTITCPAAVTVSADAGQCSATGVTLGTASTTDNCPGETVSNDAPTSFPVGTTTVTWTVSDAAGNTATCTQSVTVTDDESPTITCPADLTVASNSACVATGVTLGTASTTDNCPGETVSNDAPATFPLGTTTVTWTVTDAAGNTATCTQEVTVTDDENPTITCPAAVTVSADAGQCSATGVTLGTPSTTDNCPGETVSNDAPTSFPLGTTTVTWTVTDAAGNTATCTQSVTVTDDENPTITCPAAVTVSADAGQCSATGVTLGTASTTDNCPGETVSNDAPTSFPVGTTTVTWTVSDAAGNTTTCTQTVTVTDDEAPVITSCPSDADVSADANCAFTLLDYTTSVVATDNCPGAVTITQDITGTVSGTQTVTMTATDAAGNASTCSFVLTVVDNEDPTITGCPTNVTESVDANCEFLLPDYTAIPTVDDNCTAAGSLIITQSPAATTVLTGHGTVQTVTLTVTDANGNTATCSFDVTLEDDTAPVIACPADITSGVDSGECFATVTWTAPVGTDNCTGVSTAQTGGAAPGSTFPVGTSTIEYTTTDGAGNTAVCSFDIIVSDDENPIITFCPADVSVSADIGQCEATGVVIGVATATDNCPGETVSNDAPTSFPVGTTMVTWTVTDAAGNTATCTQSVTVTDDENPTITCPAAVTVTADAGQCSATGVALGMPIALDNCPGEIVTNDAPTAFPVGITTVTWTVTDAAGNSATCTQSVTVTDDETPTITCPAAITVSADAGQCSATGVALGMPTAVDNCPGETVSNDALAVFPLGMTTVTWTITDAAGNSATCTQMVTVTDDEAPVITVCPPDDTVNANASCEFVMADYTSLASATDNCTASSAIVITQVPAPGSTVSGNQVVDMVYEDENGNQSTCQFTVTVIDVTDPVITNCPTDQVVIVDGSCNFTIPDYTGIPTVTDNCTPSSSLLVTQTPSTSTIISGDGTTQLVTITVTDAAGNSASCDFTITLDDDTAPLLTNCPVDQDVIVDANCEYVIEDFTTGITISDNCTATGDLIVTQTPSSGTLVGDGTTQLITITVEDEEGLISSCDFTITLDDDTAPLITACPPDDTVNANASCEFVMADYTSLASATDNCTASSAIIITQVPAPGSTVSGDQVVDVIYEDEDGNQSTCQFTVTVIDSTDPVITNCPTDQVVIVDGSCNFTIPDYTGIPTVTDNCTPSSSLIVTQTPPINEVISGDGTTQLVTITVTDAGGNSASCDFTITLDDDTAPTIDICQNDTTIIRNSCDYVIEDFTGFITASDNCSSPNDITLTQSPIGTTIAGEGTTQLITITATDLDGLSTSCDFTITLDDGPDPQAGGDATLSLCTVDPLINLFDELGGTPDITGVWSSGLSNGHLGTFDPMSNPVGQYTFEYVVTAVGACTEPDTAIVILNLDNTGVCNFPPAITSANGEPVVNDTISGSGFTILEDTPLEICFEIVDPGGVGANVDFANSAALNGILSATTEAGDTCLIYTPDQDFFGTDYVTVTICDDFGLCDEVTILIDVTPVNDDPVITDAMGNPIDQQDEITPEETAIEICLNVFDVEVDQVDICEIISGPFDGELVSSTISDGDTCLTYIPNQAFNGMDTIEVVVCDPFGGSDTLDIVIEVTFVNDVPVVLDENDLPTDSLSYVIDEDTPLNICPDFFDEDGQAVDALTLETLPSFGVVTGMADGDSCFLYTPNQDYFGLDSLQFIFCDENSPIPACDTVWVFMDILPVNDNPIILDSLGAPADTLSYVTIEDNPLTICLDAFDVEGEALQVTEGINGPDNGVLTGLADGDSCYTFTPNPDWFGTETFSIILCDGSGGCDTVTTVIEVISINDSPVAENDTIYVEGDTTIDILANDVDVENDPLVITIITPPVGSGNTASVVNNNAILFDPEISFCGEDSLQYMICDVPGGLCDTAWVILEIVPEDNDGDGIHDGIETLTADTDMDGILDYLDVDSDNDGLGDAFEAQPGADICNPSIDDFDGDGVPDHLDQDADNDGVADYVEAGNPNPVGVDSDGDGIDDSYDQDNGGSGLSTNPIDTDGDGTPDHQDLDSDNDGTSDVIESGGNDPDGDGLAGDGLDSDGDGLLDEVDPDNGGSFIEPGDADADGTPDYQDLDSDNDGMPDIYENVNEDLDADGDGMVDGADSDGDGILDAADDNPSYGGFGTNLPVDSDGDGIFDHVDLDSDNDGVSDITESGNGEFDLDNDGVADGPDLDQDGIPDPMDDDFFSGPAGGDFIDSDNDGTPDHLDIDSDGDGINDVDENGYGSLDVNGDGMIDGVDLDEDGVVDDVDSNSSGFGGFTNPPSDSDGDGIPNYLDEDSDNDTIPDTVENDPDNDTQGPDDSDGDGIPDFIDSDDDNDGIPSIEEWDTDLDGIGPDDCDEDLVWDYLDSDICLVIVPQGFSPNADGVNDTWVIRGLERDPNHSLVIFNRWGNRVFEASPYQNNWAGESAFGISVGNELPDGTYYYVIEFNDGETEPMKGWVYIKR